MDETRWFRLLLVVLASSWLGVGCVWAYNAYFEYEAPIQVALWFRWLPTVVLVSLFYGERWALTGRVRPLWILGSTNPVFLYSAVAALQLIGWLGIGTVLLALRWFGHGHEVKGVELYVALAALLFGIGGLHQGLGSSSVGKSLLSRSRIGFTITSLVVGTVALGIVLYIWSNQTL